MYYLRYYCLLRCKLLSLLLVIHALTGIALAQELHPNVRRSIERNSPHPLTEKDTITKDILDTTSYRVFYTKTYHPIPSTDQPALRWMQVLEIGKNYHRYIGVGRLAADSIWDARARLGSKQVDFFLEFSRAIYSSRTTEDIIFNLRSDSLEQHDMILIDKYCYLEPIPHMDWTLLDGDTIVAGYRCQRASTHFRGRDYTAWYTEEIQLPYGPYKFRGLPGLILCLYDTARDHVFTLSGLVQGGGKWVYRKTSKNLFVIRRAQMRSMKQNYADHPDGYKSEGIVKRTGPIRKQKVLYNPIELE